MTLNDPVPGPLFRARGEIDLANAKAFERSLLDHAAATDDDRDLIVDCTELAFIDSAGMTTLVRVHLALEDRGLRLILTNLSTTCRHALELTGVLDVIGEHDRPPRHTAPLAPHHRTHFASQPSLRTVCAAAQTTAIGPERGGAALARLGSRDGSPHRSIATVKARPAQVRPG